MEAILDLVLVDREASHEQDRDHRDQHQRRQQGVAPGHLGHHQHGPDRRAGHARKEAGHAHQYVSAGMREERRRDQLAAVADHAAQHASDEECGAEDASAAARADRERGGHDLGEHHPGHGLNQELPVQSLLDVAPACPVSLGEEQTDQPHAQAPQHRAQRTRQRELAEDPVAGGVEETDVAPADRDRDCREQQIARHLERRQQGELWDRKDPLAPHQQDEEHVGRHRGDHAGDERVGLEVLSIQDLDGRERTAERRAEDGAQTPGGAGQQQDASVACAQPQARRQEGADASPDLHDGALFARAAAPRQRENGGDALHQGHAGANHPAALVEGSQHLVRAVALGLGREAVDHEPREQPTDDRQQEEEPAPRLALPHAFQMDDGVSRGARLWQLGQQAEGQLARQLQREQEDHRNQPGGQARDDAVHDPAGGAVLQTCQEADIASLRSDHHDPTQKGRAVYRMHANALSLSPSQGGPRHRRSPVPCAQASFARR